MPRSAVVWSLQIKAVCGSEPQVCRYIKIYQLTFQLNVSFNFELLKQSQVAVSNVFIPLDSCSASVVSTHSGEGAFIIGKIVKHLKFTKPFETPFPAQY